MSTQKPRGQKRPADSELQSTPSKLTTSASSKRPRPADTIAPAPFNAEDADLVIRNPTNVCFKVHKAILALASPVLAATIAALPYPPDGSVPELRLSESAPVLTQILSFIYPVSDPGISSLEVLADVYAAAAKYAISYVTSVLQRELASPRFLDTEPVRVYALAKRLSLDDLARLATRAALRQPATWPDYEEFKSMPAHHYHSLLSTHRTVASRAVDCLLSEELFDEQDEFFNHMKLAFPPSSLTGCDRRNFNTVRRCWWDLYKKRAQPLLLDVPTSDVVCSAAFVAGLAKEPIGCAACRQALLYILLPGGYVEKLKTAIDALPQELGL